MSQDPNTIPNFDAWQQSRVKEPGKRPALLWGAGRRGHRHQGEDFGGERGTPVAPDADGEVIFAGPNGNMGNTVKVRHDDGLITVYGHLNKITASQGARVTKGQEVGLLGMTGNAKGPHVHYEVHNEDNLPLDPATTQYRKPLIGRATQNLGLTNPPTTYQEPKGTLSVPSFDEWVTTRKADTTGADATAIKTPTVAVGGKFGSEPAQAKLLREEAAGVTPEMRTPEYWQKRIVEQKGAQIDAAYNASVKEVAARKAAAVPVPTKPTPRFENQVQEQKFQEWYGGYAQKNKLNPNPDDPRHQYDYRAAFLHDAAPDPTTGHWPSQLKLAGHPNRVVGGVDTITGQPATTPFKPRQTRTPQPEAVIVQQAVRNPEKLQRDLLWHYGPDALDDFQSLDVRGKKKMILYATQQAARDEIKKSHGHTLTEDSAYQAKMRARVGIKERPGRTGSGMGEFRQIDDQVVQAMQAPKVGFGDVHQYEATEARQQTIVQEELSRSGPGLPSLRTRLQQRGLPPEVVGRTLLATDPRLQNQVSVLDTPQEQARILGEREAQQSIQEHVISKGNKLGKVAQQWPAFVGYVQDLGAKTVRLMNTALSPGDPLSGELPAPRIGFMNDVSDYLANRASINQQIAGYEPKNKTLADNLVRAGVGTVYSVARIAATVEATGLSLPTVMVGESLILNSDKDPKTQVKEAAKAYALGWAISKLPVLAQKGLGKIPGTVGRVIEAHPEAAARTIGGTAFGTLGYAEAKNRGASDQEVLAETITGVGTGAGLAGGGLKRIGERGLEYTVKAEHLPENIRAATARATGREPVIMKRAGADDQYAGVYVDPKIAQQESALIQRGKALAREGDAEGAADIRRALDELRSQHVITPLTPEQAAKKSGNRQVIEVPELDYDRMMENVGHKAAPGARTVAGPTEQPPPKQLTGTVEPPSVETPIVAPQPGDRRQRQVQTLREERRVLKEQRDVAQREAETDPLTGLGNRAALDKALATAEADPNTSVVVFDANDLGKVNKLTEHGHQAGDKLIQRAAGTIKQAAQEFGVSERVFRSGGDEFTALLPKDKAEAIKTRAEELMGEQVFEGTHGQTGQPTTVRTSLTGSVGDTFRTADAALQGLKATRKSQPGQELGRITPKKIIKHTDPNIDGGEVIGTAPDGRLQVRNNSGGISLVQNPRTQGNQEATIVRVQPTEEGGLTTSATQKAEPGALTDEKPITSQPEAGGLAPAPGAIATQPGKVETISHAGQETQQIREPREPKSQTLSGAETEVAIPDSDTSYKARYSVREAEDVIPSHNPQNFQPNPDYYHTNDRRYESEPQYQMQVIDRSKPGTFDPRRIANNSPTVDVGPPVIDSDGNVLGGNSRAMILHRIYAADDQSMSTAYRQELMNQAQMYGLDPQKIAAMKNPILVRELSDEHLPQADTQRAITDLNKPSTTPLTQDERATAAASQISPKAADYITQQLEHAGDDATVVSVMDKNGIAIINKLIADGIFQPGERNTLIQNDKPTDEAKSRIERMLVSGVYRDLKQMDNTPPAVRRNIERIVVPLNKIAGTEWDIADTVRNAIDAITESKSTGVDLDKLAIQGSLAREPYTTNEIALAKVLLLGPRKTAEKFRGYGNDYSMAASGGGLFGAPSVAESQKIHFGLEPETRRVAPPQPELPTRKPAPQTIDNNAPPGEAEAHGKLADSEAFPPEEDQIVSDEDAQEALSRLIKSHRNELNEVLENWDGTHLTDDGTLERHLGREGTHAGEDEFNTDAEIKPAEFITWLFSDEPLDAAQFGDDPDWRAEIQTLRTATGLSEPASPVSVEGGQPNENGVYPKENAHKLEYPGNARASVKATATIYTLKLPEGWIASLEVQHKQGSFSGLGQPLVADEFFPTEADAIRNKAERLIHMQERVKVDQSSTVTEKQREQAQKLINWANGVLSTLTPTQPGPVAGTKALRRELSEVQAKLIEAAGEERTSLEGRAAELKSQIPDYVEPESIDAGERKAQTKADEQLPEIPSGGAGPSIPEQLGGEGTTALETLPAEPLRGTGGEGRLGSSSIAGAGQGKDDVRGVDERTGSGSIPGGRVSDESLPVSTSGERTGDERIRTNPVDHTIAAADADAAQPNRTPADIIAGAKTRAAENAEDSPTSHAVTLTGDYFIDDVEAFSSGSLKQKYQRNIDALVTLRQIQSEGRDRATPEEQATLARWIGWGQFPALMNEINDAGREWATERQALKSLLSEDEWNSAKASIKNAHYTAPQIVGMVWDAVKALGFTRGRTLEPSMGPGIFFALMPRAMRKFSQIAGVELDKATGQIAKLLYPNADIQIKGFEEYNVSDDFFDLVISNFPFGDYPVADPRYPKRLKAQIHDFFFVKSLDKVRPGGLVVGITSTGTLDKQNTAVREHLGEKADLVAAIRLPGNTFLKEAGTAVVTDLIILRKRVPGEEETESLKAIRANKWLNVVEMPEPSGKQNMVVNEYYQQHPEMIIGRLERSGSMWRADAQNVTRMEDFEDHVQRAVASLPTKIYSVPKLKQFEPQVIPAPEELKQGAYTVKDGKLFQKTGEHLHEQSPSKEAFARIEGMIGVRDTLNRLLYVETESPSEAQAARKELGKVYDAFVKKHGFINELANAKAFADDPDRYRLFALEKWDKKTKKATKTDIFTKATRTRYERPTSAKGMVDAVGIALNETGGIDLDRIVSLLSLAPEDVGTQLVAQGVAYNDPTGGWTPQETYLSGPVRRKLLEAEEAARLDPQYAPNVEALKAVQPQDVPHSKISARMGAPWIPASDIQQFMADMMGAPVNAFSVTHDKTTGRWYIGYRSSSSGIQLSGSVKDKEELGTPKRSFPEILQAAIDDKPIKVTITHGEVTTVDKKASAAANKKVREIRKKFANWIWQDDERRSRLHRHYNQQYNDTIPLKVDGSHQTFPGMNELINLRDNQKNVVWRGVTQGRVMMAHEVGTGKTFSMIAMGMERRRLKLSRKPAIACLNSNVAQVTEAAHLLYPGARILAAHEGMSADTRQKTVTQIATGDWDLVILTHDNLDDIPLSKETQTRFIKKEVDDLKAAVIAAKREAGSDPAGNRAVKDLEKKLETRKAMLQNIIDKPKDDALTFEETGIDFLMVDESHKFKSLPVYTARGSVKGIPTSRSDRATNMFMRSQWLLERNNNQGLVFATGTPISNTLVELFNVQRFLQTPELEARGIDKFDPWAATFAESQTKLEYTPTGDWMPVTRFSLFTNLADLSHLASQMMDVAFADEIEGLVRPKRKDHVITVPMSKDQKSYLQSIRARAAKLARAGRPKKGEDNWLVLTNDARKSAIDMRLIDRSYSDDPNSKLNRLINEVLAQNEEHPDLTQLIFSDMGINPTDRGISLYSDIIAKLVKGGISREQIVDFSKFSPGNKADQRAKAEGMERLSTGKAKVGLGGTEKLGTGVNVQELLYNLHHLDAPYRPSDIEQRDGRGWRDQNKNKTIRIGRYTTEGSFDTQMWQTLDTKNKFIRSFMRGDITTRTMEETDTEELSYAQIMATTSGNPLLIKKMELEAEAAELESDYQVHQDQTFRLKDQIARNKRENAYAEVRVKNLTLDGQRYSENADKEWAVTIKGQTFTRDLAEEETALAHDQALSEKNAEVKEEVDKAKKAINFYKAEAKEKGLLGKEQTEYARAQVPKAFDIVEAFKKLVEGDVEMMPQTKIAAATVAFREGISKQIDVIKANWKLMSIQKEEGVSQSFGSFKGFDLVIVGDEADHLGTALVGPSGEHHTFSWASAKPGQVFDEMEGRLSSFDRQAESQRHYIAERAHEIEQLAPLAEKPFADMSELDRLRKAVDLVTQELTASGASLPLPEGYSNLSTRYKADGQLMPEESPLDVHEAEGEWTGGEIAGEPIFRDKHLVLMGNAPGEVEELERGNWDLVLDAHLPDVRLSPVAIEDITESVWFDNGMTMPLGYFDIIMANHPKGRFALTNSRRFPNTIVVTDGGKPAGYMDVGKPKSIDDDLQAAVRMVRERAALEVKTETAPPAEPGTADQQSLGDAGTAAGGGIGGGGGGSRPPHEPPDPLMNDEDPEEAHAMAMSATRMPLSDVALPGYEKANVSAAKIIKAYERILSVLGRPTPIRVGHIAQRTALGIYKPRVEVIRLKTANNIPTAAHEVGHGIQKAIYGATKARALAVPANVKRELVALGKALYSSRKPAGGYRTEGFAEFIRNYLTTEEAPTVAPNTLRWFETQLLPGNPILAQEIRDARKATDAYRLQGAENRAAAANMKGAPSLRDRIDRAIVATKKVPDYMLDEFSPLFRLTKLAEESQGPLDIMDDPARVASVLRGSATTKVQFMVEDGMLDFASNKVGPPLHDAAAIVKGEKARFSIYMVAKRAQERWSHGLNPGMTREDANALVAQLETPKFQLAAQQVYDWNNGVLEYVKQAAPSFAPLIEKIQAKSQYYVPLARVFDPSEVKPSKTVELAGGSPLKRMKGSGRAIHDIFPQMIANAEKLIAAAHKRRVLDTIVRLSDREGLGHLIEEIPKNKVPFDITTQEAIERLEKMGAQIDLTEADLDEVMTFFTPAQFPKGQEPIVPVMRGGVMRWYYVNPDLYGTLMGMDLYRLPKLWDLLAGVPTRVFRAGTTAYRAAFALFTNPTRDFQTFVMQTRSHANPALLAAYWTRSMAAAFSPLRVVGKRDEYLDTFYRLGAQLGQPLGLDMALTHKTAKRLFRGKIINTVTNPLEIVQEFLSLPESASRVAEIRALAGEVGWTPGTPMSEAQAFELALAAKQVTVDFSAAGRLAKIINQCSPFFNAGIQGGRSFARAMRDHPRRSVLRGLLLITIPTLLLWWKNKDKEWYVDMLDRMKYMYWHIEAGDQVIEIPRAFEWGNAFAVIPEVIFDSWYRKDPEGVKAGIGHIYETTVPDLLPVVARNAKEQWQNRIEFFDRPIVPRGEIDLPPGEQRGLYTSKVAVWLGKKFPDSVSPRRVDALIRGFGGGVAPDILNLVGLGSQRGNRDRELSDIPVFGRAFQQGGKGGFGSKALESFYDQLSLVEARASSKDRPETNDQREYRLILEDANAALKVLRTIQAEIPSLSGRQQVTHLTRMIARTAIDKSLTPEDRVKKLDALMEEQPAITEKVKAEVEKKRLAKAEERTERNPSRSTFDLPGNKQIGAPPRPPGPPSPP